MPIPFLLWGAAALVGAIGIGAGLEASSDIKEAKKIVEESKKKHENSINKFNALNGEVKLVAEDFAKMKMRVYKTTVNSFLKVYKKLQKVKINDIKFDNSLDKFDITFDEIQEYNHQKITFVETATSMLSAASAGTTTGLSAIGLVSSIGYASTGTAISSLAGAAAQNATLAWFGGGSLAAGGLGIAGGVATLAGIFLGPALAVFGVSMAIKASKQLEEAYSYKAQVNKACEKIDLAIEFLISLNLRINEFIEIITNVEKRLKNQLPIVDSIINRVTEMKNNAELERDKKIQVEKALIEKKETERKKKLKRRSSVLWKIFLFFIKIFNKNYKPEEIPNEPYVFKLDPKYETEILASDFLTEDDKKNIYFIKVLGKSLKTLLEIPLIDTDGKLNNETNNVVEELKQISTKNI